MNTHYLVISSVYDPFLESHKPKMASDVETPNDGKKPGQHSQIGATTGGHGRGLAG